MVPNKVKWMVKFVQKWKTKKNLFLYGSNNLYSLPKTWSEAGGLLYAINSKTLQVIFWNIET